MINSLANCIEEGYLSNKSRSLMTLSKKSGVPYPTLRRIMQKEVKESSVDTVIKILSVFESKENVINFCEQHFPKIGEFLRSTTHNLENYADSAIKECLDDEKKWITLHLLDRRKGTTKQEIENYIGKSNVEDVLSYFYENDLIDTHYNTLELKKKNFVHSDANSVLKELAIFTRFFNTNRFNEGTHALTAYVEEVSNEGLKEIHEVYRKAAVEVAGILKKEKEESKETHKQVFFGSICGELGEIK